MGTLYILLYGSELWEPYIYYYMEVNYGEPYIYYYMEVNYGNFIYTTIWK